MILDTSVLLAIIFRDAGYEQLVQEVTNARAVAAGTPTLAQTGIALTARLGDAAEGMLERVLDEFGVLEIPFGEVHWREAVVAFRRFGKGRHSAALNFRDCLTYATARLAGEPLRFVGGDFTQTDLG